MLKLCQKNSSVNLRFKIFDIAFRARKLFGTFEKRVPGLGRFSPGCPCASYIGMRDVKWNMVFEPFWSEIGYTFGQFWSENHPDLELGTTLNGSRIFFLFFLKKLRWL